MSNSPDTAIRPTTQVNTRVCWHTRRTAEVRVGGEVDLMTAPRLVATLGLVHRLGAANVLVDLDDVTFLGVVGVRALAEAADRVHLRVTRASREAARTLTLADPARTVPRPSFGAVCDGSGRGIPWPRQESPQAPDRG